MTKVGRSGLKSGAPGMSQLPTNSKHCCIYRVPNRIRKVNPKAYTPQLVILGPLHYSPNAQASKDMENTILLENLSMEQHKKSYLSAFKERFDGEDTMDECRGVIRKEEKAIRASYSESTTRIESKEFIEMILDDSVFILEFILRCSKKGRSTENAGDVLMDQLLFNITVYEDLILLENQLPFFILENLFDSLIKRLYRDETFRTIIIQFFGFKGKINGNSQFKHFTDLFRCVRVNTLKLKGEEHKVNIEEKGNGNEEKNKGKGNEEEHKVDDEEKRKRKGKGKEDEEQFEITSQEEIGKGGEGQGQVEFNTAQKYKHMEFLYNAEKLHNAGIKFQVMEEEFDLDLKFENGCLKLPVFVVEDGTEMILRNIMALEQCHYPYEAHVCSYIFFLDYLIDTDKDIDILVEKGIIKNWMGEHGVVAEMVNKLSLGMIDSGSGYRDIARSIEAHYTNPIKRLWARLKRVYFSDIWTGTATVAAMVLLVLTLLQTIASFLQVTKEDAKPPK